GRTGVQARSVARSDGAVVAEGRLQLRERLERHIGAVVFVPLENDASLARRDFDRRDLRVELARRLRAAESCLCTQRPAILSLTRDLELRNQVFGHPAR